VLEPLAAAVQPFPPTATSSAPLREKLPLIDRLATLLQSLDQQAVAAEALRRCGGGLGLGLGSVVDFGWEFGGAWVVQHNGPEHLLITNRNPFHHR